MKLKSKLIATIVSICAAIAVMGVGVWAATSSFQVTVNNTVGLQFENLTGTVKVSASAGADEYADGKSAPAAISNEVLFENGTINYSNISGEDTSAEKGATANLKFEGYNFLTNTYLGQKTQHATVLYDFVYDAAADATVGTTVTLGGVQEVTKEGILAYAYYVSADGNNWTEMEQGTAYKVAATKDLYVRVVATYTNTAGVSLNITSGSWNFNLTFEASSEGTDVPTSGTTVGSTITNGQLA